MELVNEAFVFAERYMLFLQAGGLVTALVLLLVLLRTRRRRIANAPFIGEAQINLRTIEIVARGCAAFAPDTGRESDRYSIPPNRDALKAAYELAKEVFEDARSRDLSIRDLGYTHRRFLALVRTLDVACRASGVFDPKTQSRLSFVPAAFDDGSTELVLLDDYVAPSPPPFIPIQKAAAMLRPSPLPDPGRMRADEALAEQATFDMAEHTFVQPKPDKAAS